MGAERGVAGSITGADAHTKLVDEETARMMMLLSARNRVVSTALPLLAAFIVLLYAPLKGVLITSSSAQTQPPLPDLQLPSQLRLGPPKHIYLPHGSRGARDLLIVNPGPADLSRLLAKGFDIDHFETQGPLGLSLKHIAPPSTITVEEAPRLLLTDLAAAVYFNHTYRIPTVNAPAEFPGAMQGAACTPERCYGASLIGWHDQLAGCAKDVRIGLIDTAVDAQHPNFLGRRLHLGSFLESSNREPHWHATAVLTLLAGNPQSNVPGLVPDAEIFVASVFHQHEKGTLATDTATVLKALRWMEQSKVEIINLSLSGPWDALLKQAIAALSKKGMVFVAPAGDGGPAAPPSYPAAYRDVIAVTAIDRTSRLYAYANQGPYIDLAAPGIDIWTALPRSSYGYVKGTAFATPYATAAIAAIYRSLSDKTKAEVLRRLTFDALTAFPGKDPIFGRGVLQAPASCSP